MQTRKHVPGENEMPGGQIAPSTDRELSRHTEEPDSRLLVQVVNLAFTGDREAFLRIVSLFVLLVGAVVVVGAVVPWASAAAAGGASAWVARRARRGST
ncbi:hypothetical protein [Amycolatopsis sp. CA-128772]|uniref:hypothetical protein n=1 Tax=Amycolatopsis sp. CA-128772 TaxID=2073159 RepID=UPI0011B0D860|nr:hypothetical protein [Amycolatopsis sp. CA-128772]